MDMSGPGPADGTAHLRNQTIETGRHVTWVAFGPKRADGEVACQKVGRHDRIVGPGV